MAGLVPWNLDTMLMQFLNEDLGPFDLTTQGLGELKDRVIQARIIAKEPGVMAGGPFVLRIFKLLDREAQGTIHIAEGARFPAGTVLLSLSGRAEAILEGERVALNLLARLSGIATRTRELVDLVADLPVRIADTRKTTPGLRLLEKYAVCCGGGTNHRMGLYDCVLIKDNHLALCGSVKEAVLRIRKAVPFTTKIVVECASLEAVAEACEAGVDVILLDNMPLEDIRQAVKIVKKRALVEASGGIGPHNVRLVAEQGVDIISTGYITHHAPWIDLSLSIS
ncbi:carboxylating nicotinate-nucleotide diphosphorylase [Candidatus Caldatribacterium sp. SIUC1]|uniref:carboxylating nicotinate-nucleotide diphosphorylase n=1 Tax=Candidatus Caldatribacterium sp. SIUC1 TaxID=3418365 RepID=UPI003F691E20